MIDTAELNIAGPPDNLPSDSSYLQSPMSDGTIEEDFEAALARDRARAGSRQVPRTVRNTKANLLFSSYSISFCTVLLAIKQ